MDTSEIGKEMDVICIRIPDSRPKEVQRMSTCAYNLKERLVKTDFMKLLQALNFSFDDIENLSCVMLRYPKCAINEQQMKWLEEYKATLCDTQNKNVSASTNESGGEVEQAKEDFRLKYGSHIENVDSFFETLKTIKARRLKKIYDTKIKGCGIMGKTFLEDCLEIVPERKYGENRITYDNFKTFHDDDK